MSALPKGWMLAPLMDIVDLHDYARIPLNQAERARRKGPFPYYGANGQVDSISDYIFDGGYILLAEDGGYFDDPTRAVAYEVSGKFWANNHAHVLSPKSGISQRYLTYALNHLDWSPYVGGSTRLKLTQDGMRRVRVPLAPAPEQLRIVATLDKAFERTSAATLELARIPALAERQKETLLSTAIRGELTSKWRVDHGLGTRRWKNTTLGAVALDIRYGTSAKCHYEPKKVPVIRIPNVINGTIDAADLKYGSFTDKEIETLALQAGDILVIRSNGSPDLVGRAALVTDDIAGYLYAGYLIRIRLDPRQVHPPYVRYALASLITRQQIADLVKSTNGVNNINAEQLKGIELRTPPLEEQREIADLIDVASSAIDRAKNEAARASNLLDRLRRSILAKAFQGELTPGNPSDEPASALLKRVRNAKAVLPDALARAKLNRKLSMPKLTIESAREAIRQMPDDQLTLEDLRNRFPADYESLRDLLFNLLSEDQPAVAQIFDLKARAICIVRCAS